MMPTNSDAHTVRPTQIHGLLVATSPIHDDERGWFTESWQREKLRALGMPDLDPVQQNVAISHRGVTRGIHAEPWDKLVGVAIGHAHGVWVDLRPGPGHGRVVELELVPGISVRVPRGVGNAYQVLEDNTAYVYLVDSHWRADATYVGLHPGDPDLGLSWPIALGEAILSDKDRAQPYLSQLGPVLGRRTAILGARGKVGRALVSAFPDASPITSADLDLTDSAAIAAWPWDQYDVVINAAAYTGVDGAESPAGRLDAWALNAIAPAQLAKLLAGRGTTLVHFSTDYVYDGTRALHTEDEPLAPLGEYGASKAAGDLAVSTHPRYYLIRTSWVIGDSKDGTSDFISTMLRLARDEVTPTVVNDQIGRLTFADELARATRHLLDSGSPYGTYLVSNSGEPTSWHEIAQTVFEVSGRSSSDVEPISSSFWAQSQSADRVVAPRPASSTFDLTKIHSTGFRSEDAQVALGRHLRDALSGHQKHS